MPSHPTQWTDFLQCSACEKKFSLEPDLRPVTLLCSHTVCKRCIPAVYKTGCRHDPNCLQINPLERKIPLPINLPLLKILAHQANESPSEYNRIRQTEGISPNRNDRAVYENCISLIESMSEYLEEIKDGIPSQNLKLTKPMLRKLVGLIQCQIAVSAGRIRALRACRAIGERAATELILAHQNPATLSANLWTAVRLRGCQFLGPAMQDEALRLILLALEDGSELSRKVLVMFVVNKLQKQFSQASKTSVGHVVQLLYRASCFVVKKRDGDSSLMKLKEEYRTYTALRREHDTQVVQIAREAGLRIAPDQWSALLYGDQGQKPHMQSIIDRLQSDETLARFIQDLTNALEKSNSHDLKSIIPHFEPLVKVSVMSHAQSEYESNLDDESNWNMLCDCLQAINIILQELVKFSQNRTPDMWRDEETNVQSAKFKTSFCRDIRNKGTCPRGASCTFAHTEEELHLHRNKRKKASLSGASKGSIRLKSSIETDIHGSPVRCLSPKAPEGNGRHLQHPSMMPVAQEQMIQHERPQHYQTRPVTPIYHPAQDLCAAEQPQRVPPIAQQPHQPLYPPIQYRHHYMPTPIQGYQKSPRFGLERSPQNEIAPPRPSEPVVLKPEQHYVSPNPQQQNFTVTLSFQATADQQSMQLSRANITRSHSQVSDVNDKSQAPYPTGPERYEADQNHPSQVRPMPIPPDPGHYAQQAVQDPTTYHPMQTPDQVLVPYPPAPQTPVYHPEPQMFSNSVPQQPFGQGHVYQPHYLQQVYRQTSPISRNVAPILMAPPPQPHQSMFVPVMPMQPYKPYEQTSPPQMRPYIPYPSSFVHSGAILCTHEQDGPADNLASNMGELQISKSVEQASVEDLVRRKREILQQMIQNQHNEEPVSVEHKEANYYDVWRCKSYSPLLCIGSSTATIPENLNEKRGSTVSVTAELDTKTKQVTVRGVDHLNPSHARNERILDDEKMHQLLRAKNIEKCVQASSNLTGTSSQSVPGSCEERSSQNTCLDDEVIPFSDRPIVSKYGPIARSTRTRPSAPEYVQVSANAGISAHLATTTAKSHHSEDIYSSLDNHDAITCFSSSNHFSHPTTTQSYGSPSTASFDNLKLVHSETSLSQATFNSRLVRREQAALQQNETETTNQDLELLVELQQIELGLQQKKQFRG